MTITERTLRNWRKDALKNIRENHVIAVSGQTTRTVMSLHEDEINERILRLTQELLDQHLMKGK